MSVRFSEIEPTPDVFAVVMATGILSIAARDHHYPRISDTMGVIASIGLAVLVALVVAAAAGRRLNWDMTDPDVTLRLFTFVAACAVLDNRVASRQAVLHTLGVIALSSWLVLILLTARNMSARLWGRLRDHAHGAWELASVGTSGLAIVMAQLARYTGRDWWLMVATPVWAAAIGIYGLMTWLVLWRAVAERQDRDGFEPDTWILMGGLAIATLAGDYVHLHAPHWLAGTVRTVTVVTWVAATLWIPPLIYFTLHRINQRPAMLQFRGAWWAMVFPLGMYSAATYAMALELKWPALRTVSLVVFWDTMVAWVIVAVAGVLRARRALAR